MIGSWPDPHPDELFYSICARYSERVRYSSKRFVVAELFGTNQAMACVSLPSHLGYLVSQLPPNSNYDIDSIIEQPTLLQSVCLNSGLAQNNGRRCYRRAHRGADQ